MALLLTTQMTHAPADGTMAKINTSAARYVPNLVASIAFTSRFLRLQSKLVRLPIELPASNLQLAGNALISFDLKNHKIYS
jgi:hypothetical protein